MLLKWSVRPQVKAFSKRLLLEVGNYPCSRAVLVTSVSQVLTRAVFTGIQKRRLCSRAVFANTGIVCTGHKGHEKAKRRAFFRMSSKNSSFRTVAPALFALLLPPLP